MKYHKPIQGRLLKPPYLIYPPSSSDVDQRENEKALLFFVFCFCFCFLLPGTQIIGSKKMTFKTGGEHIKKSSITDRGKGLKLITMERLRSEGVADRRFFDRLERRELWLPYNNLTTADLFCGCEGRQGSESGCWRHPHPSKREPTTEQKRLKHQLWVGDNHFH